MLDVFERLEGIMVMGSRRLSDFQYVVHQAREQGQQGDGRISYRLSDRLSSQKHNWIRDENFNIGFTLTFRGALFENGLIISSNGKLTTLALVKKFWNILDKLKFGKANVEKRNIRYKRMGIKETGFKNRNTHWHYVVDVGDRKERWFKARATYVWEVLLRAGYIEWNDDIGKKQDAWAQYSSKQITTVSSDVLCTYTTHLSDEIKWHKTTKTENKAHKITQ